LAKVIKEQFTGAVNRRYLRQFDHKTLGFADVPLTDLLAHLDIKYGKITQLQLEANLEELDKPWNPEEPIEDLWTAIETCIIFAEDDDPISYASAIRKTLTVLEKTGVFNTACDDWRK
jgi:hypothetical protein